ncbi:rRNA maturation RNase YbeY [Stieleria varia]|uniref:Endoribonuclease YbeY n=1 Tax=Stieleria varia TaxID=2528005 RepID=A0A5C6AXZ3_9BACT|nr:rRNA maturation RNase YbeY [Stieleria varia]TWU04610.1 Endoribonuclease YbeY [Stieleria varia]
MSNTPDNSPRDRESSDSGAPDERDLDIDPFGSELTVEIRHDSQIAPLCDDQRIKTAVQVAAASRGFTKGDIGVRLTSDATIREINAQFLQHDYATDVISFGYEAESEYLSGELVVSVDTAARVSATMGQSTIASDGADWPPDAELILYIVHGVLHITGMDDQDPESRSEMRRSELSVLTQLGLNHVARFGADMHPTLDASEVSS